MALPPGLTAKSVTIGIASFTDGSLAEGTVTITAPVNLVHTPTNRPIFSSQMSKRFVDGEATFDLLPTDAPGLNRIDWVYKANVVVSGALVQPEPVYFLLPTAGPNVIDLDGLVTVPSSAGIPVSVTTVTSVNGQTGDVTVNAAPADGSVTPAKLSFDPATQAELDALSTSTTTALGTKVNSSTYTAGLAAKQDAATLGAAVIADATARALFSNPPPFMGQPLSSITSRGHALHTASLTNGTMTTGDYRHRMPITRSAPYVVLMYANWNGIVDTASPNPITIRASVEAGAQFAPVTFNGRRDYVLDVDGIVFSDPIPVTTATGDFLFVRSRVTVQAGEKWPRSMTFDPGRGEGTVEGVDTPDLTTSGTITTAYGLGFGPIAVLAPPAPGARPLIVGAGDSINAGTNDSTGPGQTTGTLDWGIGRRLAVIAGNPYLNSSQAGARVSDLTSTTQTRSVRLRRLLAGQAGIVFNNGGVNDLFGQGRTAAQLANDLLAVGKLYAPSGIKVVHSTCLPYTTSTDSWATVQNQAIMSNNTTRIPFNQWLRAGAPIDPTTKNYVTVGTAGALTYGQVGHPLHGYVDLADEVESSRDSGLWKATGVANAYTADGIHPSGTAYTAMQSAKAFTGAGQVTVAELFAI